MTEIFYIFLHLLIITVFCYPSKYLINFFNNGKANLIEKLEIGIVFNIFLLLAASFFLRKDSNIVLYFLLCFYSFNLFFLLKINLIFLNLKKL